MIPQVNVVLCLVALALIVASVAVRAAKEPKALSKEVSFSGNCGYLPSRFLHIAALLVFGVAAATTSYMLGYWWLGVAIFISLVMIAVFPSSGGAGVKPFHDGFAFVLFLLVCVLVFVAKPRLLVVGIITVGLFGVYLAARWADQAGWVSSTLQKVLVGMVIADIALLNMV